MSQDFGLLETPASSNISNTQSGGRVHGSSRDSSRETSSGRVFSTAWFPSSHATSASYSGVTSNPSEPTSSGTLPLSGSSGIRGLRTPSLRTPASGSVRRRSGFGSRTPRSRGTPYGCSSSTPAHDAPSAIVALVEGRGLAKGEVGVASIDLRRPELQLSQFSDTQSYSKVLTKLQLIHPVEVVMPNTACETGSSALYNKISDTFPHLNLVTVQRKYFNETKGMQAIAALCLPELNSVQMEVKAKYYCLAAAATVLKYVEFIQSVVYAPSSLKVVFKGSEQTTMIDMWTCVNLELLQNRRDPRSDHTLYGVLNHTKTPMGARMLRSNILQPPSRAETIEMRLDVVEELTSKEELFYSLQAVLSRFLDTDHLLSLCVQIPKQETMKTSDNKITQVIHLKHTLELVTPLQEALQESVNPLFRAYVQTLGDPRYAVLLEKIRTVIHEDTHYQKGAFNMRTQKCFAVRQNINGLLDVSRKIYMELIDEVTAIVQQLSELHGLPLRTAYNATRGFYMTLYCGKPQAGGGDSKVYSKEALPPVFIKVTQQRNTLSFTTLDMIRYNDRIKWALQEIYLMTNVVMEGLLNNIREHMGCLYSLTECVATCDLLLSFAHTCTLSQHVRPDLTDTLAIKQGRHPILQHIRFDPPVPNNMFASRESNFIVITGPNMSGKSTYLRQVALLQIMAQLGCFLPAEYASVRVATQIFSRIGSDDDIETNCSTFMLEMKEMNYIVQNASPRALIIIDELGRGTSTEEGVGICHAICEYLISLKAFTFFATHFMQLTNLGELYPTVENYHFEMCRSMANREQGTRGRPQYTHVICKGKTQHKHYGLQLAEVSALPREIVSDAKDLVARINRQAQAGKGVSAEERRRRAVFKLAKCLVQVAANSRLDAVSLSAYLGSLRQQYAAHIHPDTAPATDAVGLARGQEE